eukprot:1004618_1
MKHRLFQRVAKSKSVRLAWHWFAGHVATRSLQPVDADHFRMPEVAHSSSASVPSIPGNFMPQPVSPPSYAHSQSFDVSPKRPRNFDHNEYGVPAAGPTITEGYTSHNFGSQPSSAHSSSVYVSPKRKRNSGMHDAAQSPQKRVRCDGCRDTVVWPPSAMYQVERFRRSPSKREKIYVGYAAAVPGMRLEDIGRELYQLTGSRVDITHKHRATDGSPFLAIAMRNREAFVNVMRTRVFDVLGKPLAIG